MSSEGFLEEVAVQVIALAQAAGVPILVTLGLLLVSALLLVAARHLPRISWPKPDPPPPEDPPAAWNDDPAQGAVVVPGPPGGSDQQNQAG